MVGDASMQDAKGTGLREFLCVVGLEACLPSNHKSVAPQRKTNRHPTLSPISPPPPPTKQQNENRGMFPLMLAALNRDKSRGYWNRVL